MKKYLIILFLFVAFLSKGQDVVPTDTAMHTLPTYSFKYYTADSSLWMFKGSKYKTTKLVSNKRLNILIDSLLNLDYKRDLDSVKSTGYMTNQKFIDINRNGFLNQSETTISFTPGDSTFTLYSVGTSWSYYRNGRKHTITGSKTLKLTSPISTSLMYLTINDTLGNITVSTSPWTLFETGSSQKIPISTLKWNNSLTPKYILSEERHSILIDRRSHTSHHYTEGTELSGAVTLSNWTANSDVDANKAFHIAACNIFDEDIYQTLAALTTPNGADAVYYNLYKSGGAWVWQSSAVPFKYTTTGYIEYDASGSMTAGQNNKYYNTYLYLSNVQGAQRYFLLSGKGEFASAPLAYGESFSSFDLTGIPTNEGVAVYQITWKTSASYSGKGKCVIDRVSRITANVVSTSVTSSANHNTLTGLQVDRGTDFWHLTTTQKDSVISAEQHADTVRRAGHATIFDLESFKQKSDSTANSGYASVYDVSLKKSISDSTANSGYASIYDISLKKDKSDSTANSGYASVYDVSLKVNKADSIGGAAGTYTTGKDFATHEALVASAGASGHLSAANWSTFNGKQAALDGTGYVKFTGTTPSYVNETYKLRADSVVNSGFYTNYKAGIASYLANDTWTRVYDYAGNLSNLWKLSKDNIIEPGFKLGIQSLYMVADAGKVTIADMPNVLSLDDDTLQYKFNIGNVEMLKMRGIADGSGGLKDTTIIIPKMRLTRNAVNGYYLKVVDTDGTIKPSAIEVTYQGTWNATTNTPTLADGTGTAGFWYRCTTAGTQNLGSGNITFAVGDDAYHNGTIYQKVPGVGYTLQNMTKTVLGGAKLDSVTLKYNGSGQLYVVKTDYVENATHSGDATGATALTLATVNDSLGYYNYISANAKGLVTGTQFRNYRLMSDHDSLTNLQEKNYSSLDGKPDLSVYRLLNNHDSLSTLDEKAYASLTGKPDLSVYRLFNNHDSLSTLDEKSYNSLTDKPTSLTLPNNIWSKVINYAGDTTNFFKLSPDNIITPAFKLGINSLFFVRNSGLNSFADLTVDSISTDAEEHGWKMNINNIQALKLSGKWNMSTGIVDSIKLTTPLFEMTTGAAINKIAMSEDSRGKMKWSDTKYLFTLAANRLLVATAVNEMGQLSEGTTGKILMGNTGAVPVWTTPTYPNSATQNKLLYGTGANIALSVPSFPDPSVNPAAGNMIRSNGTDWLSVSPNTFLVMLADSTGGAAGTYTSGKDFLTHEALTTTAHSLNTWVGTTNITTLGTIGTGTWNATAIADGKIASAATWNAKQAALNGTGFVKISGTTISYDNSTYLTAAITSLGGLTGATQTFAIGTSGTEPAWSSATTTHTLNIPMASTNTITAGLLSHTDYDNFNNKPNLTVQGLSGTTVSWNVNSGINATLTMSGNTTITLSNLVAGTSGNIRVTNHATTYTLTFAGYTNKISPAVFTSANVVTMSGGSKIDVYSWFFDGTYLLWNGTLDYK